MLSFPLKKELLGILINLASRLFAQDRSEIFEKCHFEGAKRLRNDKKRRVQKRKGSEKKGFKESEKRRGRGVEDPRIQVVLLESFFKTKRGKESEKRLSLAEPAENAEKGEKDEICLWTEF